MSKSDFRPWGDVTLNIAYSTIGLAPINTRETFYSAAKCGFNAQKCDVRISRDGVPVLCHDPGFTLDENGHIGKFDKTCYADIHDMTYGEISKLTHAAFRQELGYGARVATLDEMLSICLQTGMVPVVTLRDTFLSETIPAILSCLSKYSLTERCLLNSMSYDSLVAIHEAEPRLCMSYTLKAKEVLTPDHVDRAEVLSRCLITMFSEPFPVGQEVLEASAPGISYGKQKEIPLFMAQVNSLSRYRYMLYRGFTGFHIMKPYLDYGFRTIPLRLQETEGVLTAADPTPGSRYEADVTLTPEGLFVENIRYQTPKPDIPDGVIPSWYSFLPYRVSGRTLSGAPISVLQKDRGLLLPEVKSLTEAVDLILEI